MKTPFPQRICRRLANTSAMPKLGEFVTPQLVMDDGLIIGISTSDENPKEQDRALRIHAQLAAQFENTGYGAFANFLGSLRSLVLEEISTQRGRQRFFDTLIDCIPHDKSGAMPENQLKCCLGFCQPRLFDGMRIQHGASMGGLTVLSNTRLNDLKTSGGIAHLKQTLHSFSRKKQPLYCIRRHS